MNKVAMYVGVSLIGSAIAAGASAQVRTVGAVTHFTQREIAVLSAHAANTRAEVQIGSGSGLAA